jgi:hypothetical protein
MRALCAFDHREGHVLGRKAVDINISHNWVFTILTAFKTLIIKQMSEGDNTFGARHLVVSLVSETTHLAHGRVVTNNS